MSPAVSVIVPVYNTAEFLRDCLDSVLAQTLRDYEVVAIDDGSTDGSADILDEYAAAHGFRVVHQENSGGPGAPRNTGIDLAKGEFLFFLDSDDTLTPDALRNMVEVARREGSDVVLGKMAAHDHRTVPQSMFVNTNYDVDVIKGKLFNTLGPTKLFRRSFVLEVGERFATDMKVGEDQPFVAAMYLRARKISVLADMDYYMVRRRPQANVSATRLTAYQQMFKGYRLAQAIDRYAPDLETRDALLFRPLAFSLALALDRRFLELDEDEKRRLVDDAVAFMSPYITEGSLKSVKPDVRARLHLLMRGDPAVLTDFIEWLTENEPAVVSSPHGLILDIPERFAPLVPVELLRASEAPLQVVLTGLQAEGRAFRVGFEASLPENYRVWENVGLRLVERTRKTVVEVPCQTLVPAERPNVVVASGLVESLQPGVWDAFVESGPSERPKLHRLGKKRSPSVGSDALSNVVAGAPAEEVGVAYFTNPHGNLSFNIGGASDRTSTLLAGLEGITEDEDGRCEVVVRVQDRDASHLEFFAMASPPGSRDARQLLPTRELGPNLIALRLPVSSQSVGVELYIEMVARGVRARLRPPGPFGWSSYPLGVDVDVESDGTVRVLEGTGISPADEKAWTSEAWEATQGALRRSKQTLAPLRRIPLVRNLASVRKHPFIAAVRQRARRSR
jgi:glycosyltransferase involved in cell wall biosynthesis